ncbi:MAG: winged helix-turn-helix transcriptional regulator [Verrucomicrobia bacterium]|nr:winged helix-turn-helix transcriptional regulator [Verrucomicrobiota bacterium]
MREFINIARAMADRNRVRLLLALREGELCACQLTALLGLAPSTVSRHLALLQQARLLSSRKDGRWIFFKLAGNDSPAVVREALDWVFKSLARSEEALADRKRLAHILKLNPSDLCKRQCRN